ncbi:MAG: DUF1800 domain-containing protein [Fimbriimonadaceae bacterium]|nr:DUF1800 domain-containing protein [Fimbriimonadaceae bacterium]
MATVLTLFQPTRTRPWDRRLARHLLERAGFGGGVAEVDELVALGPREAVQKLLRFDPPGDEPQPEFLKIEYDWAELRQGTERERQLRLLDILRQRRQGMNSLKAWWLQRMVATPTPLQEKLTLFWHGHFATEAQKVKGPNMMYGQHQLLRRLAKAPFRDLLLGISKDPAMLIYLDNHLNVRGRPNENYARELMELFSLGIGHYTEQDVSEVARAFTGWTLLGARGGQFLEQAEFLFNPRNHDDGSKTVLGATGNLNGEQVIDVLLQQPACAPFLVRKLWRFFVHDELDPTEEADLTKVANVFRACGYQLEPVLETVFLSEQFYAERRIGAHIKSPCELVVGTLRKLGLQPTVEQATVVATMLRGVGQDLFDPPNVAGWAGGREWINTSTLLQRYNFIGALLTGSPGGPRGGQGPRQRGGALPPAPLQPPAAKTAAELVATLEEQYLAVGLDTAQRRALTAFVEELQRQRTPATETCRQALHVLLSTPNYQVC